MSDVRLIDANALKTLVTEPSMYDINVPDVLALIDEAPTIEAQVPEWIPVEERLPETADDVLVCVTSGFMFVGYYDGLGSSWELYEQSRESVTHWMPLPSAPEEVVR